jgi:competence protein ComGC
MNGKEGIKQEKAITMIALVVMIVVLIILAGITIASVTSDNGVIKEARTAKELAEKAALEEQVELSIIKTEQKYRNPTINDVIEQLIQDKIISKGEQVDQKTGDITTDAGYVIEGKLDDYIGKKPTGGDNTTGGNNTSGSGNTTGGNNTSGGGEVSVPDLKEGEVTFKLSETEWTNQPITVEIECSVTGYILQYSTNSSNWNNYTQSISVNENGYIYARLSNSSGKTGGSVRKEITNIDKLKPEQFTPTATSTTNSITLTGSATDAAKTATDGSSGIEKYYFSKDNGVTWEPTNGQTGTSYTFNGLMQNQTYNLKMKAVDKAGNEIITDSISKNTGTVTDLTSANVTFSYNPTTPTKGSVAVSIATTVTGYTLQYSTNGTTWNNYAGVITMTNNGEVHARLWDGTNAGGYATGNVANIDRLAPNQFTPTATSTSESITLTGSTTDAAKTATDGSSGIEKYYFSKDNGTTWEPTNGQTATSYTFNGLTIGETYQLKMKAVDKAGNEVTTNTISQLVERTLPSTDDTKPFLPEGSTIISDDLDTGVIIKDSNDNEWVWIEVPKSIYNDSLTNEDYIPIETAMKNYASEYRHYNYEDKLFTDDNIVMTPTEYNNLKNEMLKSVFDHGGFYVGRFEVGTKSLRRCKRNKSSCDTNECFS